MKKVYIAGPLFTGSDRNFVAEIDQVLVSGGFGTYLPHRDAGLFIRGVSKSIDFFKKDLEAIKNCQILVAVLNGSDTDSGTSWEMGFAYANGIPIIGILDDNRKPDKELLNPMVMNSSINIVKNKEELIEVLKKYNE